MHNCSENNIMIDTNLKDTDGERLAPEFLDFSKYYGNFKGFIQYRKTLKNENRKDNRVIKYGGTSTAILDISPNIWVQN